MTRRDLVFILTATLMMAAGWVASPGAGGLESGPWPMFHRNAAHEGRTTEPLPTNPALLWSASVSDSVETSSPAVTADGTIYIGNADKELWAMDPSGNRLWTFQTQGNIRRSSPAVAQDGTIYIGSNDGNLYAINPDSTLKWVFPTGGAVKTSPAVAGDGTIFVGSDDAKLWAVNPNGSERWSFTTGDTIRSSPAVLGDTLVVFGSNDGFIYALNFEGGLAWSGATGGPVKGSPAVGQGGSVIVGSFDGFLYNIYHGGSLNWATFVGEELRSSPAIGITGKIYLGAGSKIQCYRDEGDLTWEFDTGAEVESSPAVAPGAAPGQDLVVCGSDDGKIYMVDPAGDEVWSFNIGSPVRSSPAIGAGGKIFVGALNGRVYAFGSGSASAGDTPVGPLRLIAAPNPLFSGHDLVVRLLGTRGTEAALSGRLDIFSASGRRLRTVPVGSDGSARWDGRDASGRPVPSGVYLYRWTLGREVAGGRIIRLD